MDPPALTVINLPALPTTVKRKAESMVFEDCVEPCDQKKLTVLVVDDQEVIVRNIALMLEHDGYQVIAASSGQSAAHTLSLHPNIDALVTEIMLAGINGFHLAAKARSGNPRIALLLISTYPMEHFEYRIHPCRPDQSPAYFLQKPFLHDKLQLALQYAIAAAQGGRAEGLSVLRPCWLEQPVALQRNLFGPKEEPALPNTPFLVRSLGI